MLFRKCNAVYVRNVAVQIISVHFDEREVKLFLLVVLVVFLRVVFVMLVVFLLVVCVVLVV